VRTDDYAQSKKQEMLEVARLMLADRYDLIEGCRRIASLGSRIDARDDPTFVPFRGFASEMDGFPRGQVRQNYAVEYLQRLDTAASEYPAKAKTEILIACGDLLARFGG